jgi:glutamate decarboxylase
MGPFELITDGSQLPVVAFRVKAGIDNFTVFDVSRRLRERGWQVPAYTFPAHREDLAVLRIVVRNGFSHDLAALFLADLERLLPELAHQAEPIEKELATSFRH